ncbi:MAG: hypothetical protein H0V56_10525 [Chthoniobacterales bacterium]|nr:hypothetical protein [Chthoniobacterales bacterium]
MRNVTLSVDDEILRQARAYAQRHGTTLNQMIRELLERTVTAPAGDSPLEESFRLADGADSRGWKWNRSEIYDSRGESPS